MTDWDTLSRLCREALSREGPERAAFLDQACAGNATLRRQLESILEPQVGVDTGDWLITRLGRLWDELLATGQEERTSTPRRTEGVLARTSPFSALTSETIRDLLAVMRVHEFEPGEHLIRQGDPAEFLLLILGGSACARVRDAPADRPPVGEFGEGDVVGEISLVTDEPRTADVVAQTRVRALQLSASDFNLLAARHPDLPVVLTEVVAERLGGSQYDGLGGKDIRGYQIVQCIGRGGMGVVYEAKQAATGQRVALKMMNHRLIYQPEARRRFRREAAVLQTFDHPMLSHVYECFPAYKTEFLAMEFCEGSTLAEVLATRGTLPEREVRALVGQLAVAIGYVHNRGIVHRDLKPSNIVLTGAGGIKLLDFGIVTVEPHSDLWEALKTASASTRMVGTPRYMAPEQFSDRPADRRADFYSLACIAFEALSGRPVATGRDFMSVVRSHAQFVLPEASQIGEGVSAEMHAVLATGLQHDPERRTMDLERLAEWAAPIGIET
jgi:CRP-like cAMP-binding protein